jgi:hypothetical protein
MTKEQLPQAREGFPLSKNEQLFERVSDKRFQQLVFDPQTHIHEIKQDSNAFGEFLFVTVSHPKGQSRDILTFWGLGYHAYRERWLSAEWRFYETSSQSKSLQESLAPEEAKSLIEARRQAIQASLDAQMPQTARAALFEILADLTDEDGAVSKLEDLANFGFFFGDEDP